jgi:DNA-binding NarL/FixJ family response regulator
MIKPESAMARTRVLLAEDHTVVAEGLQALLKDAFELAGTAQDGRELVKLAVELRPDVIVTDVSMPGLNGLEAIRQIKAKQPAAKIVVLTMHRDTQLAVEAIRAGATGYMLKVSPSEELIQAIREVARGRVYVTTLLSKDLITLLMEAGSRPDGEGSRLTPRQREVLQLVAEGRTMKEVAAELEISPRTAESHKYDIMQALGVETTAELVQYAVRNKLIVE